jgi:hypothetical protein
VISKNNHVRSHKVWNYDSRKISARSNGRIENYDCCRKTG